MTKEKHETESRLKSIKEELVSLKNKFTGDAKAERKTEIETKVEAKIETKPVHHKPKPHHLQKNTHPAKIEKIVKTEKLDKVEKEKVAVGDGKLEKMYVIPMGGIEEVGKNMTLVQYRDEIIILDCGCMFPDETLPGIDLVIPDFSYIENNKDKVKGLFITHGHEDHIGAIPYLYQKIDRTVPMYGGKLTLALVKSKFEGLNFTKNLPGGKEIKPRTPLKIGKHFKVEFIRVTHSIADAYSIAVTTPAGTIILTGDFKIDLTPVDGQGVDFARFSQLGEEGVDLLISDSTNSEVEGFTPSEKSVGESLKHEFARAQGRIFIAAFASHIHRLQQIVNIAHSNGRKIALDGRSMVRVFEIAKELGYLKLPKDILVDLSEVDTMKENKVVVLCTGTQGEPLAALSRIAKGMHKFIKVKPGDTVIISATPIPGNEKAVSNNINFLAKEDVSVVFKKVAGIHVSGHAAKEEQKLMINLVKPKHFMPVHGEYRMLKAHMESAMETGIAREDIIIATNGTKVEVTKKKVQINGKVNTGITLIDGLGVGDIGSAVIKDRTQLSEDGVVIITVVLSKETKKVLSKPEILTKGFPYSKETEKQVKEIIEMVEKRLQSYETNQAGDIVSLRNGIREIASKHFYAKVKRNPVILATIIEL